MDSDEITYAAIKLGFQCVTPDQRAAIEAFMSGCDVFVSYQLEAGSPSAIGSCLHALFDRRAGRTDGSVVIVVSPLHALMKDQIEALTRRDATAVHAGDANSDALLLDRVAEGRYQFVFISPEMLLTEDK